MSDCQFFIVIKIVTQSLVRECGRKGFLTLFYSLTNAVFQNFLPDLAQDLKFLTENLYNRLKVRTLKDALCCIDLIFFMCLLTAT